MKRIMVLMAVAAQMVVMLATTVAPAFAAWDAEGGQCRTGAGGITTVGSYPPFVKLDRNDDGTVCYKVSNQGVYRYYDNRLVF